VVSRAPKKRSRNQSFDYFPEDKLRQVREWVSKLKPHATHNELVKLPEGRWRFDGVAVGWRIGIAEMREIRKILDMGPVPPAWQGEHIYGEDKGEASPPAVEVKTARPGAAL
jgi:hypothetical protein